MELVITETLPLTAVLSLVNCHFSGTPLEPGLPEFATQVPQGTSSGRVVAPDCVPARDEDERDEIFEEDDDDDVSTGVIPERLELLAYTGVIPEWLELLAYTGVIPERLELDAVLAKGLNREDELSLLTGT